MVQQNHLTHERKGNGLNSCIEIMRMKNCDELRMLIHAILKLNDKVSTRSVPGHQGKRTNDEQVGIEGKYVCNGKLIRQFVNFEK